MKHAEVIGVSRAIKFSPHCEDSDAKIFQAAAGELRKRGFDVKELPETDLQALADAHAALFFSMARGGRALELLREKETAGALVINSPECLIVNNRAEITRIFDVCNIPAPDYRVLSCYDVPDMPFPYWLKRGDACAQNPNDVCFVENISDMRNVMTDFDARNVTKIVVHEHLEGDLVKFYGVEGTDFFYTCFPTETGSVGKFGLERVNGEPRHYNFDREQMHAVCTRAAGLLGFTVYGGDCVVDEKGVFRIIDFNDWPSFSRCRNEAALAIAQAAENKYMQAVRQR